MADGGEGTLAALAAALEESAERRTRRHGGCPRPPDPGRLAARGRWSWRVRRDGRGVRPVPPRPDRAHGRLGAPRIDPRDRRPGPGGARRRRGAHHHRPRGIGHERWRDRAAHRARRPVPGRGRCRAAPGRRRARHPRVDRRLDARPADPRRGHRGGLRRDESAVRAARRLGHVRAAEGRGCGDRGGAGRRAGDARPRHRGRHRAPGGRSPRRRRRGRDDRRAARLHRGDRPARRRGRRGARAGSARRSRPPIS